MKWVEQLQAFTFSIKHKKGTANKVADGLSWRITLVEEVQIQSMGINSLTDLYKDDLDFGEIHKVFSTLSDAYNTTYLEYLLQNGLLFRGGQLCIPKCSMRENLIREKHCGTLGGHFGVDKTMELVRINYFWPKIPTNVRKFFDCCTIC